MIVAVFSPTADLGVSTVIAVAKRLISIQYSGKVEEDAV